MNGKLETMLGFAQKAGKIVSGEDSCRNKAKQGKVFLLIISHDASDNTKDAVRSIGSQKGIKILEWGSKVELGLCIGKAPRAVVAVLDRHFAKEIENLVEINSLK